MVQCRTPQGKGEGLVEGSVECSRGSRGLGGILGLYAWLGGGQGSRGTPGDVMVICKAQ